MSVKTQKEEEKEKDRNTKAAVEREGYLVCVPGPPTSDSVKWKIFIYVCILDIGKKEWLF